MTVAIGPLPDRREDLLQRPALVGEEILDSNRRLGVGLPGDHPLDLESLSRAHSIRSLMSGMPSRSSEKRVAPPSISRTMAPDQRRPMSSTAVWKSGQKFELWDMATGPVGEITLDEEPDLRYCGYQL